jgi:hypothetical protein
MSKDEEIDELKARLAKLEARAPPPLNMEKAAKEWANEMHQGSEARMSHAVNVSQEQLQAYHAAGSMINQIVMRDNRAPTEPSSQGIIPSSQLMTSSHPLGGGTGWLPERRSPTRHRVNRPCRQRSTASWARVGQEGGKRWLRNRKRPETI